MRLLLARGAKVDPVSRDYAEVVKNGWHVKSRALRIQPYFESGFPYGHDQWISHPATAWAVMALSVTVPEPAMTSASRR